MPLNCNTQNLHINSYSLTFSIHVCHWWNAECGVSVAYVPPGEHMIFIVWISCLC